MGVVVVAEDALSTERGELDLVKVPVLLLAEDDDLGERVCAAVALRPGSVTAPEELTDAKLLADLRELQARVKALLRRDRLIREEIAAEQAVIETAAAVVRIQGVLSTPNVVSIPAPIEGILDTVTIDVGVEVYENQLLAQVMNTEIEIELQMLAEERGAAQDAVNEMEPVEGFCTHRSHWVTRAAVKRVERQGNRLYAALINGEMIPVSRKYRENLENAGLI